MNLYVDLDQMRRRYFHDSALATTDQAELLRVMGQACRGVDEECERFFYRLEGTRYYDGAGFTQLWLPDDVISITTLKVDEDGDLVYELELTEETDFWLWPDNETPKTRLDVNPESSNLAAWPSGRKRIEIAGSFGYTGEVERESVTATVADASTTTLTSTGAGALAIGQTLLLGTEQVYITATGGATTWTITRGVNGTTAAAHIAGTVIDRFVYDELIVGAALMWAGRLWKRRETADATTVINPMMGTLEVHRGMDADVKLALEPRVRAKAAV